MGQKGFRCSTTIIKLSVLTYYCILISLYSHEFFYINDKRNKELFLFYNSQCITKAMAAAMRYDKSKFGRRGGILYAYSHALVDLYK